MSEIDNIKKAVETSEAALRLTIKEMQARIPVRSIMETIEYERYMEAIHKEIRARCFKCGELEVDGLTFTPVVITVNPCKCQSVYNGTFKINLCWACTTDLHTSGWEKLGEIK